MSDDAMRAATENALDLLYNFGQNWVHFARRPTIRDIGDPDQLVSQALAESQRLLSRASERAFLRKVQFLNLARTRQLLINYMHFATGSAFILLIAGKFPRFAEWAGALVALCAGTVSILLPSNLGSLEQEVLKDTEHIAQLIGEVSELQVSLATRRASESAELAKRASQVVGKCITLAKKYQLQEMTSRSVVLPRSEKR